MRAACRAVIFTATLGLSACVSENATLPLEAGTGPSPQLPAPAKTLLPTVKIAPAVGWPSGGAPTPAAGLKVVAFAARLDHPRWLHVLPNGDVLVALASTKPKKPKNIQDWVKGRVMKRVKAVGPSADQIVLLRDGDGDGTASASSRRDWSAGSMARGSRRGPLRGSPVGRGTGRGYAGRAETGTRLPRNAIRWRTGRGVGRMGGSHSPDSPELPCDLPSPSPCCSSRRPPPPRTAPATPSASSP